MAQRERVGVGDGGRGRSYGKVTAKPVEQLKSHTWFFFLSFFFSSSKKVSRFLLFFFPPGVFVARSV